MNGETTERAARITNWTRHDREEIRFLQRLLTQTVEYLGQLERGELPRGMKGGNPASQRLSLIAAHCEFALHKVELAKKRAAKREVGDD